MDVHPKNRKRNSEVKKIILQDKKPQDPWWICSCCCCCCCCKDNQTPIFHLYSIFWGEFWCILVDYFMILDDVLILGGSTKHSKTSGVWSSLTFAYFGSDVRLAIPELPYFLWWWVCMLYMLAGRWLNWLVARWLSSEWVIDNVQNCRFSPISNIQIIQELRCSPENTFIFFIVQLPSSLYRIPSKRLLALFLFMSFMKPCIF